MLNKLRISHVIMPLYMVLSIRPGGDSTWGQPYRPRTIFNQYIIILLAKLLTQN